MKKFYRLVFPIFSILLVIFFMTACSSSNANGHNKNNIGNKEASSKMNNANWRKSSENKPYPNMNLKHKNWLFVSTKKQRVYVMSPKHKVLYTMYCSTGSGNSTTPKGTYHIQAERGSHFYNASSGEGANYWTSWKDHGVYLFHSVPVNKKGKYLMKDAHELGKKANSHGCVRLSVPDAKWINQHVPFGTKVVIK